MTAAIPAQERIDLRTSHEIKELIVRAAATTGQTVSAFLLGAAQERARQVLAESELLTLSPRDWEAFFAALDRIEKPRPNLESAMQRRLEWQKRQNEA